MIENLGIFIILISGALAWASDYFGLPWLASVALVLFGAWVIIWGIEIAFKGEVTLFNRERWRSEFFSGIPAGLWSAIFITFGAGIVFLAWLDFSSPAGIEGFLDRLVASDHGRIARRGPARRRHAAPPLVRLDQGSGPGGPLPRRGRRPPASHAPFCRRLGISFSCP